MRQSWIQLKKEEPRIFYVIFSKTQVSEFDDEFGRYNGVEQQAVVDEQLPAFHGPVVQVSQLRAESQ